MNVNEVMQLLESFGSEQTRKTYARHGVTGAMFGVSSANLGTLKKKIKTDPDLARELWASGNYDARILSTMIAGPAQLTTEDLDSWVKDLNNYPITDAFAKLAAQTEHARKKAEKWRNAKDEWTETAGWGMLAHLVEDQQIPDSDFESYIEEIEQQIHTRPNRVRHTMNMALIAIGLRNPDLQRKAIAAAKRIGKLDVDHGDTSCKTPDVAEYIQKTLARREKQHVKAKAN
jgi:3-methyladenine DNA glycosylase AlkD